MRWAEAVVKAKLPGQLEELTLGAVGSGEDAEAQARLRHAP